MFFVRAQTKGWQIGLQISNLRSRWFLLKSSKAFQGEGGSGPPLVRPVAGSNLPAEKVSILGTILRNSCFRIPFYSSGLWSGKTPHLQSVVILVFVQTFEQLFSKKKPERRSPRGRRVVKCREFEGKIRWNELCPFHEITGFTLTLPEKVPRTENSEEKSSSENRDFFREHTWSCDRRHHHHFWILSTAEIQPHDGFITQCVFFFLKLQSSGKLSTGSHPDTCRRYRSPHIMGFPFLPRTIPPGTDQHGACFLWDHSHVHNHSRPQFTNWGWFLWPYPRVRILTFSLRTIARSKCLQIPWGVDLTLEPNHRRRLQDAVGLWFCSHDKQPNTHGYYTHGFDFVPTTR